MKPASSITTRRPHEPIGFTLIEIAVCLVILGLLTGTAALSLRGMKKSMDFETWVEQLAQLDRQTRQRAEQQGQPWEIVIDLTHNTLWSTPTPTPGSSAPGSMNSREAVQYDGLVKTTLHAPKGWRYVEALTDDQAQTATNSGTGGQVPVRCSTRGLTPTYAIQLRNEHNQERWLLAAGGSGQWLQTQDALPIQNIFATLRNDAD